MTLAAHVWDDFRGGDYGDLGGFNAPPGTWTGLNMRVNRDGSLCPRKGAVSLAPTSPPSGSKDPFVMSANVDPVSGTLVVWVLFGDGRSASVPADVAPATAWTNYTSADTNPVEYWTPQIADEAGLTWFGTTDNAATNNYLIKVDHTAHTMTRVGAVGADRFYKLAIVSDRMVKIPENIAKWNQLTFSAGPDETTLATQYGDFTTLVRILAGSLAPVVRMIPWRNTLLAFKDTEVWQFQGDPTDDLAFTLRRIAQMDGGGFLFPHPQQAVVTSDQNAWIASGTGRRPVLFTGVSGREVEHIDLGRAGRHIIAPRRDGTAGAVWVDALLPVTGETAGYDWCYDGTAWLRWQLTRPNAATLNQVGGQSQWPRQAVVQCTRGTDHLFWCERPQSANPNLYRLPLALDGPGLNNSPVEQPGDGSTTALSANFTLPHLVARDGHQITVRKVIVDVVKYRTGGASTNHLDVVVNHYDRYRAVDNPSSSASWDEANTVPGAATGDHKTHRIELVPQNLRAAGAVELAFTNVRGLSISRVAVVVDDVLAVG